jgi:hypothetical protein
MHNNIDSNITNNYPLLLPSALLITTAFIAYKLQQLCGPTAPTKIARPQINNNAPICAPKKKLIDTDTPVEKISGNILDPSYIGLSEAIEILEARIRYNIAYKKEIAALKGAEELRKYFYNLSAYTRTAIEYQNPQTLLPFLQQYQQTFITAINDDITKLINLLKVFNVYSNNQCSALQVKFKLYFEISREQIHEKTKELGEIQRRLQLRQQHAGTSGASKQALKNEESYIDNKVCSELQTFVEISNIFDATILKSDLEKQVPDYFTLHSYIENSIDLSTLVVNDKFMRYVKKMAEFLTTINNKIRTLKSPEKLAEIKNIKAKSKELQENLNDICNYLNSQRKWLLDTTHHHDPMLVIDIYSRAHELNSNIKELNLETTNIQQQINAIESNRKAQAKALLDLETQINKERELILKNKAQLAEQIKQEQLAAIEQQKANQMAAIEADNAKLRAQEAAEEQLRQATAREKNLARKNAIEAAREQRIQLKHTYINTTKPVETSEDGTLKSTFCLPAEIITKNLDDINEFMHLDKISYAKTVTFIKKLGGQVDDSTGSSHHKLIFNNIIYQYIQGPNALNAPKPKKLVSGLYCPNGDGDKKLAGYELSLVKEAIASILPPEILLQICPPKDNKPKFGAN